MSLVKQAPQESLSKREQRKLEQTLKLFQATQPKPKKKRKHNERGISLISQNKMPQCTVKSDQPENLAETKELSQFNCTPQGEGVKEQEKKCQNCAFLNLKYFQPLPLPPLLPFFNEYQYRMMEKDFQKHCQSYESLDQIGTDIPLLLPSNTILLNVRLSLARFRSQCESRLFGKAHIAVSALLRSK